MSRELGGELPPALVSQLDGGAPVLYVVVDQGRPVCALGRAIHATEESVEFEVFSPVKTAGPAAIHTLAPMVCMIRGHAEQVDEQSSSRVRLHVEHVKDDRPPGLAIEPLEFVESDAGEARTPRG